MSRTRVLSRRHLVRGGLVAGLALTGSAFSFRGPAPTAPAPPLTVAQAVALPSVVPAQVHARRASRGAPRTALAPLGFVTRDVAVGRTFSGYASWYGGSFQGQHTASGERFDTHELTAASRSFSFGTRLRVCRRSQCVVVRVNDRGPYVGSRVLDLSQAARDRLGRFGVARVTVTPIASRRLAPRGPMSRDTSMGPTLPSAATDRPVPAASTPGHPHRGAVARLAAGTLLSASCGLSLLRDRRSVGRSPLS